MSEPVKLGSFSMPIVCSLPHTSRIVGSAAGAMIRMRNAIGPHLMPLGSGRSSSSSMLLFFFRLWVRERGWVDIWFRE